jgi:hypothetical protein
MKSTTTTATPALGVINQEVPKLSRNNSISMILYKPKPIGLPGRVVQSYFERQSVVGVAKSRRPIL